jgi:hypothetical protein
MAITYSSIYRYRNLIVMLDKERNDSALIFQLITIPSEKSSIRRKS